MFNEVGNNGELWLGGDGGWQVDMPMLVDLLYDAAAGSDGYAHCDKAVLLVRHLQGLCVACSRIVRCSEGRSFGSTINPAFVQGRAKLDCWYRLDEVWERQSRCLRGPDTAGVVRVLEMRGQLLVSEFDRSEGDL